jgi:hypothetical protein
LTKVHVGRIQHDLGGFFLDIETGLCQYISPPLLILAARANKPDLDHPLERESLEIGFYGEVIVRGFDVSRQTVLVFLRG